jgi:glycine/D-amino acid oxidase-like deaminating enzyme
MMTDLRQQAERFGAEFSRRGKATASRGSDKAEGELLRAFRVFVGDSEYQVRTVIVATGAKARELGLASEKRLSGRGRLRRASPASSPPATLPTRLTGRQSPLAAPSARRRSTPNATSPRPNGSGLG